MNVILNSKSFYKFMKRDAIVLAYFYEEDFWSHDLNERLSNIFLNNNNGNITILLIDLSRKKNIDLINSEDITNYPIIRLYKSGKMFQEIYTTYTNIEEIVGSLLN